MEVITLLSLLALPSKLLGIIKTLRSKDPETAISTLMLIGLTIGTLLVAANATVFEHWVLVSQFGQLGQMNFASLVLLGTIYGSGIAKAYDVQNAFDNTSTAKEPRLLARPRT